MTAFFASPMMRSLRERLVRLYGEPEADIALERLAVHVGRYGTGGRAEGRGVKWSQQDAILITYADMIRAPHEDPLVTLKRFLDTHLTGVFNTVHLLPFFPSSSDDGFAVIHYRQVRPDLGRWEDIQAIGRSFHLMIDLVLNHVSAQSGWFDDFKTGTAPGRDYFIEVDPAADLSAVIRPRTSPLLTPIMTRTGRRHVWTTFSADQVDLNYARPDVLFEMLDLLLFYISQGARIIRLDAVAFLWKQIGTPCLHLPQTHEIVRLFRDFLKLTSPDSLLLTETNVPHAENLSYLGAGDEAHLIYQFPLPPLILHAFLTGSAATLTRWARELTPPPAGCSYLNFTASHDGIGIRPIHGLISDDDLRRMIDQVRSAGGAVSSKTNPDGSTSPYELNITWFDALRRPDRETDPLHAARFLASQTLPLALQGIPAVYFQALTARPNNVEELRKTGRARSINRGHWKESELQALLDTPESEPGRLFRELCRRLRRRTEIPAFHPDAPQSILDLGPACLAVERHPAGEHPPLLALHNVTDQTLTLNPADLPHPWSRRTRPRDLLAPQPFPDLSVWTLEPYAVRWLSGAPD